MALYEFGSFRFDAVRGQLYREGEPVELAQRAVRVLECLLRHPGRLLSKQELLDNAWGDVAVAENSLLEAVKLIRQALGDDAAHPIYVQTVRRRGYRFVADVTTVDGSSDEAASTADATPSTSRPPATGDGRIGPQPSRWTRGPAALAVLLLAVAMALVFGTVRPWESDGGEAADGASLLKRFEVALHPGYPLFNFVAVSPDGRRLAYTGRGPEGHRLLVKGIDEVEWTVMEDTDFVFHPTFSPDGREIAFGGLTYPGGPFAIHVIAAQGGPAREVMVGGRPNTLTWEPDGFIYYSAVDEGSARLRRVAPDGGSAEDVLPEPRHATDGDRAPPRSHSWVQVLPGGRWLLTMTLGIPSVRQRGAGVAGWAACLRQLDTGEERILVEGAIMPRYLSSGHLVYNRGGALRARRLDPRSGDIGAEEVELFTVGPTTGIGVSDAGVLLYTDMPEVLGQRPVWIDRIGEVSEISWPADAVCTYPALSPDGTRVAAACASRTSLELTHIRVQEADRSGAFERLTPDGSYASPVWSIDGERLFYAVGAEGIWRIESAAVASPGERQIIWQSEHELWPAAVSPDGSLLAFLQFHPETNMDIWMLPLGTTDEAWPYLASPSWESGPRFSPNGRWIAYHVGVWRSVTERPNVFVAPVDKPEHRTRVSSGTGHWPAWAPDGSRLFYLTPWNQALMALDVTSEPGFTQSVPEILLRPTPMVWTSPPGAMGFDIAPDGDRFLFSVARMPGEPTRLYVVLDLIAELERLLPAK